VNKKKQEDLRIAICGNLAGVANEMLLGLRRSGVKADLYVKHREAESMLYDLVGQSPIKTEWIRYSDIAPLSKQDFEHTILWAVKNIFFQIFLNLRLLRYDLIHSHSGSLLLSPLAYGLFVKLKIKRYLAFATGSDLREIAQCEKSWKGHWMRNYFRNATRTLLLNVDMLGFKDRIGLSSARFFPFVINENKFHPPNQEKKQLANDDKIICFMMSNLDFGIADHSPNRKSTKHNDRFFIALSEFIKENRNIRVVVLDRGPDKEEAKKIVHKLGLDEFVYFHPPMSELQRLENIQMADIVVDQFDLGAFGLGALEALSVGKPLITFYRDDLTAVTYNDSPPILNARTSEDILIRLREAQDPHVRQEISEKARQWILRNHSRGIVVPRLLLLYQEAMKKN
jgi:glycosyltransferase involved in cell wall biosynthesis